MPSTGFRESTGRSRRARSRYALLSLFPLVVLFVSIASAFIDRGRAAQQAFSYVATYVPITAEMERNILDTISGIVEVRRQAGGAALLTLGWAAMSFFAILIRASNRAWGTDAPSWWRLPLKSVVLLAIMLSVVILGITIPIVAKPVSAWLFPANDLSPWLNALGSLVMSILVVFLSLALFYKLAPHRHVRFGEVRVGALVATALLLAAETVRGIPRAFRFVQRRLWGVRRDHSLAAVDLPFRVPPHLGACLCAVQAERRS